MNLEYVIVKLWYKKKVSEMFKRTTKWHLKWNRN